MNGLEDTPALRERALATQGYAGFREQLVVRRELPRVRSRRCAGSGWARSPKSLGTNS